MNLSKQSHDSALVNLSAKGQDSHTSTDQSVLESPSSAIAPQKAQQELWEAVKTIITLQNQIPPLGPLPCHTNQPLSFTQERLWLLDKANPGTTAYNLPFAFHLQGALNVTALDQSLTQILQRHTALRTTVIVQDGKPLQAIAPLSSTNLVVVDLQDVPAVDRPIQVKQHAQAEAQRPFNLSTGPLMRATLLKLGESNYLLLVTIHHIVFDGWSEGILWRELTALYAAFCAGQPSPLAEPSIQYSDYAHWQRQWMQGEFLKRLLSYWQGQLNDCSGELPLPTDHPRPTLQRRPGKHISFNISQALTAQLKALSRQEGTTLFAILLAAFKVLLHYYSDQDEILVCTPVANRNRKELQQVIGYFVNLLALRTDLSGNPSFRSLVGRVRQVVSGAYAHQDLPVQQVVSSLEGVQIPLSQVMFVLQNMPHHSLQLQEVEVSQWELDSGTADFDLALTLVEQSGSLTGKCSYNSELFETETIEELLQHFEIVLQRCVETPEAFISQLLPLSEAQQQRLHEKRRASQTAQRSQQEYVAPRNEIERQLVATWQRVLGIQQVGVQDNFFELGGYSLLAAQLIDGIEQVTGRKLPLSVLIESATIEKLAKLLTENDWSEPWPSLVPMQPNGSRSPFFCVHGVQGNILTFLTVVNYLGTDQPFYGLQARGLDGKQAPFSSIEDMAASYIQEIRTVQPQGPYYLGGYSFGGKVAFEMAQQLNAQGETVALLVLFDTYLPGSYKKLPDQQRPLRDRLFQPWSDLLNVNSNSVQQLWQQKIRLKKRLQPLSRKLGFNLSNSKPHKKLKRSKANTSENPSLADVHLQIYKKYIPKVYPGQLTLFLASKRGGVPKGWYVDPEFGWGNLANEGVKVHYVPGGHRSLFKEPHVPVLAETLRACLDQAQREVQREVQREAKQ
jgi:thioesterase domain-containing protein/acyl carrier protein